MDSLPWIWTHISLALLTTAVLRCRSRSAALCTALVAFVVSAIPVGATDVCGHALPFVGLLSSTTLILLLLSIYSHAENVVTQATFKRGEQVGLLIFLAIAGTFVAASGLGFTDVDVYYAGYHRATPWLTLALSLICCVFRYKVAATCLLTAVLASQAHANGSPNLLDYIVDPWLTISSVIGLAYVAVTTRPLPGRFKRDCFQACITPRDD